MECLDKRSMLAADIGSIIGTTFIDLNGNGLDAGDTLLGGVEVRLFRDGGDGVFGGDDTLVQTVTSDGAGPTLGQYRFDDLFDGLYFVQQTNATAPAELNFPDPIPVTITNRIELIDDYSDATQIATANSGDPTVSASSLSTSAIGGARDVQATYLAGISSVEVVVDAATSQLGVSAGVGTNGEVLVQYDGNDGTIALDATGLNSISLAGGAPGDPIDPDAALMFSSFADIDGATVTVRIYTDATNFSTVTRPIPVGGTFQNTSALLLTDFTIGGGTGADFNNVGAIEALIISPANVDAFVSIIETVRPDVQTVDLQNIQPLTVGNLVFQDNDNDGIFGVGDVGIAGVDVELYQLTSLSDTVDPNTQTPVAVVTTNASGIYSFTNINPGIYAAVIPAREFDPSSVVVGARTLVGFVTSTPAIETAGANAKVDNDDDGRAVPGELYVATAAFGLISGMEPTNSGNTNDTIDFGFVSNADLQLTKSFVSLNTLPNGTREATFRIDVLNNGPLGATGVTVVDTLPTGLTFDRLTSTTNPLLPPTGVIESSVNGSQVTFNLSNLGSTAGTSFNIIAIVAADVFVDLTNSATVDADQNDPNPGNNTDDALLDIPQTDLAIAKTVETTAGIPIASGAVQTGDTVVYRLVVTNEGPDNATGVSVVDTLPVGVTFVSGTINGGAAGAGITFDANNRQVTAAVGNVTTTTPAAILLTATINANAADLITNTATVSNTPDTDANTDNDTASVQTSVNRAVDLAIIKAISTAAGDNTTAVFGAPVTFVITVTNTATSPGDARGFTVTDTLPAGLTFVNGSFNAGTSGVTIATNGQELTFTGGALSIGQSVSFTFDALVAQSAGTTMTNTAVVAPINSGGVIDVDINSANNSDPETINPARVIELVVTKDDNFTGTQTATPGGNITYTIVVSNTGPSDAVNVNVLDTLPAGVTANTITIGGSQITDNNPDAGLLGFVIPVVPSGAQNAVSVIVTATIAASVTAASITNQVTVSGGGTGDLPAGNTASVTTPLAPVVDVQVVKTGPATAVPGGAAIGYNLAITNTGPSVATNVSVTDDLPAGVTIQSITLNGSTITNTGTNGDVQFVIPTLLVGAGNTQNAVITVLVDPATTGVLSNTATVSATGDTTPLNNTSTISTTLNPTADITVSKTVNNAVATPGSSLTYTIVVSNSGPSTAAGVTLVDVLPAGVTFTSGSGPNGQVLSATGQTVNANVGSLAPNATATYTIIAAVGSSNLGSLVNQVTVATTTSEGANTLTNVASATTLIDPGNYAISGLVFNDKNNNGLFDTSDRGIPDVVLRLRINGNTTPIQTTTTDAQGNYRFSNLTAGTYTVEQVQPAGFRDGLEQAGPGAIPENTPNDTLTVAIPVGTASGTVFDGFNFAEIELLSKRRFLASSGN